jgi:hypothetical protein
LNSGDAALFDEIRNYCDNGVMSQYLTS